MAWIYLAESEESHLHWNHGSDQSLIVKTTGTAKVFCCPECDTAVYHVRQSGMISQASKPQCCVEAWMSFTEDSLARTSVVQEMESAWMESDQGYSSKSFDCVARFDPDSFSWRTSQLSLFGGLTEFSWSSLRWGMIVDGRLYQPLRWVPLTCENDGGCLPTPTANEYGSNQSDSPNASVRPSLNQMARSHQWPTPTLEDSKCNGSASSGGRLNPTWVEWLMGYPCGWTALGDSETQWFRKQRGKRS